MSTKYMETRLPAGSETKITRIDLIQHPTGVAVRKYEDGWTAGTNPVEMYLVEDQTLDQMKTWLAAHNWTVIEWPALMRWAQGARAFIGPTKPVRTKREIMMLRSELSRGLSWRQQTYGGVNLYSLDLAVYL